MNKRRIGKDMEIAASNYLTLAGYDIIGMNYYTPRGEIDIIAYEGEYLVFIEVKFRETILRGYPEEAIDIRKQKRIKNAARYYLMKQGIADNVPCRYDVVVMLKEDIKVIVNAFE